jgi:hypothetical protein
MIFVKGKMIVRGDLVDGTCRTDKKSYVADAPNMNSFATFGPYWSR